MAPTNRLAVFEGFSAPQQGPAVNTVGGGGVQEFAIDFPQQSYFDNTLRETALRAQPPNQPLVTAGLDENKILNRQVTGSAIALHPCSETPVAIEFYSANKQGKLAPIILKPGQFVRPMSGSFAGFRVGLPFGWLGGGLARLVVFQSPDARVQWETTVEVPFHRTRMKIIAPASMPARASFPKNWPLRFPWRYAVATNQAQGTEPTLVVTPTRSILRLRVASLASSCTMTAYVLGSRDFDTEQSDPGVGDVGVGFTDMSWPTYSAAPSGYSGYPMQEAPFVLSRMGCDKGSEAIDRAGVQFVSSDALIQNQYLDVIRYGTL